MIFAFALLATFLFGFVDYVGYNTIRTLWVYRILQVLFVALMWILLYFIGGIWCSVSFFILHFTFCADFIYYIFYDTLKWYGSGYAGNAYVSEVMGDKVTWAWWTFYGLVSRWFVGKKDVPIAGEVLIEQATVGLTVTVLINLVCVGYIF